ncbi:hypothetical protein DM860_000510 [Cuscuta australis]|uniref:GPI-anchored protein LLG1-like domain-containing protein n=1 Tax=Cuscuta australis TaxID=267555 RepID=A0A328CXG9_9ASTE|nr:hypothetical protein DM860_000510 [Cuscuta australis]
MERIRYNSSIIIIKMLLASLFYILSAFPTAFSEGISSSTGRSLLQIPKECPISFEFKNYTIITSQCRGPHYPPKQCCDAFVRFACPFAPYLNNFTECSKSMFDYLNLRAQYPTGLFSSLCKGDREGLPCFASAPPVSQPDADSHSSGIVLMKRKTSRLAMVSKTLFVLVFAMVFILA